MNETPTTGPFSAKRCHVKNVAYKLQVLDDGGNKMKLATLFKRMITLTLLMLSVSVLTSSLAYGAQNPETLPVVAGADIQFTALTGEEGLSSGR
jgi:hypothetical protein